MNTILDLQKLTPAASVEDFNIVLASSVSSVCPTEMPGVESRGLEFE